MPAEGGKPFFLNCAGFGGIIYLYWFDLKTPVPTERKSREFSNKISIRLHVNSKTGQSRHDSGKMPKSERKCGLFWGAILQSCADSPLNRST